jgi:hypothetical protein
MAVAAEHVHRRCRVFDAKIRAHRDMRLEFGPHVIADGREEIERSTPREVREQTCRTKRTLGAYATGTLATVIATYVPRHLGPRLPMGNSSPFSPSLPEYRGVRARESGSVPQILAAAVPHRTVAATAAVLAALALWLFSRSVGPALAVLASLEAGTAATLGTMEATAASILCLAAGVINPHSWVALEPGAEPDRNQAGDLSVPGKQGGPRRPGPRGLA